MGATGCAKGKTIEREVRALRVVYRRWWIRHLGGHSVNDDDSNTRLSGRAPRRAFSKSQYTIGPATTVTSRRWL
eukprot:658687-Heterocapsa_arctica.AAC.1